MRRWLVGIVCACSVLVAACEKPPPAIFVPITASPAINTAVVVGTAVGMQAKYGCTAAGCAHGGYCDQESKICRRLGERPEPRHQEQLEPASFCGDRRAAPLVSPDGALTLCRLPARTAPVVLRVRARNDAQSPATLTVRGARALSRATCATKALEERLPEVSVATVRSVGATPALPSTEPTALELPAESTTDFEITVAVEPREACRLAAEVLFGFGESVTALRVELDFSSSSSNRSTPP